MKIRKSIKKRITRAFVLLALVLSSFFTYVAYTAVEYIEAQLIDGTMGKVADQLIDRHENNQKVHTPPDMRFYANTAIPKELEVAKPGVHEAVIDGVTSRHWSFKKAIIVMRLPTKCRNLSKRNLWSLRRLLLDF